MLDDKNEIKKQWDVDPCGAVTVQEHAFGTHDFFKAARMHRYEVYAPWFKEIVPFNSFVGKKILEVGVGLGSDHYSFALNNEMTGLDLSKTHLELTKKHLSYEGLKSNLVYGDAESMPFDSNSFDIVYSFGVLHHTPNTEKSIQEVYRVLKPGGLAIIGLYHKNSFFYWLMTIFWSGILKLGFLTKGYRKLMSEIEYRKEESSAVPLVKVFSRNETRQLFNLFSTVDIKTSHIEPSHFARLEPLFSKIQRSKLEKYLSWGGWYVFAFARK